MLPSPLSISQPTHNASHSTPTLESVLFLSTVGGWGSGTHSGPFPTLPLPSTRGRSLVDRFRLVPANSKWNEFKVVYNSPQRPWGWENVTFVSHFEVGGGSGGSTVGKCRLKSTSPTVAARSPCSPGPQPSQAHPHTQISRTRELKVIRAASIFVVGEGSREVSAFQEVLGVDDLCLSNLRREMVSNRIDPKGPSSSSSLRRLSETRVPQSESGL